MNPHHASPQHVWMWSLVVQLWIPFVHARQLGDSQVPWHPARVDMGSGATDLDTVSAGWEAQRANSGRLRDVLRRGT